MTTNVQDILKAARALPPHEQLVLLQGIAQSLAQALENPLAAASEEFRAQRPIEELAQERDVPVVTDMHALAMPEWLDDETADDLISFVQEQRAADMRH